MTTASLPVQVLLVQVPVRVLPVSLQALSVKVFLSSVPVPEPSVPMSILQELISIAARVPINQSCYTTVTVSIDFCPPAFLTIKSTDYVKIMLITTYWPHSSCLESLRGESKLMTLGNLICAGCGTGNGGGVGCAGGKVGRNPTLPPAHPPLKGKKGGPPLSSH